MFVYIFLSNPVTFRINVMKTHRPYKKFKIRLYREVSVITLKNVKTF